MKRKHALMMIPSYFTDDGRPRINVVVEEAVVEAAKGDCFEEAVGSAVGAAGRPVREVRAGLPTDDAGLGLNQSNRPIPSLTGGAVARRNAYCTE